MDELRALATRRTSAPITGGVQNGTLNAIVILCIFKTNTGKKVDGLIYPSSIKKDGKCIVLLFGSEDCSDEKDKVLWLDKSTVKRIEVSSIRLEIVDN